MAFLAFQVLVFTSVAAAWFLFGKRASFCAALAWTAWTAFAVHTPWLILLQSAVAWIAYLCLRGHPRRAGLKRFKSALIALLVVIAGVFFAVLLQRPESVGPPRDSAEFPQLIESKVDDCFELQQWRELLLHGVSAERAGPPPKCPGVPKAENAERR